MSPVRSCQIQYRINHVVGWSFRLTLPGGTEGSGSPGSATAKRFERMKTPCDKKGLRRNQKHMHDCPVQKTWKCPELEVGLRTRGKLHDRSRKERGV